MLSVCSISSGTFTESGDVNVTSTDLPEHNTTFYKLHTTQTEKNVTDVTKSNTREEKRLFHADVEIKGVKDILSALSEDEVKNLSNRNMPLRHFRAEKGDTKKAIKKIKSTIAWRKEFEVSKIITCLDAKGGDDEMADIIAKENETGKIIVRGYDKEGRANMYLRPANENTKEMENHMRHLTYNIERAAACTKRNSNGLEKINIFIDYQCYSLADAPSLAETKYTLTILQDHYPEILHRGYICNPPRIFRIFWSLAKPFIDPKTKEKIVFLYGEDGKKKAEKVFNLEKMEACAFGSKDLRPFHSKEYIRHVQFDHTFDEK